MLSTEELKNYVYNEIQTQLGEVSCGNLFFAEGTDNSVEGTYIFNKNNEYHILFTEKGKIRSDIVTDEKREVVGICPRCGSPVYEGRKNYYCSNRSCAFCLWKESRWLEAHHTKVTKKMAREFLKTGRARNITLYSEKKGRNFEADLVMEDTGKYINYRMEFPKREEKKDRG